MVVKNLVASLDSSILACDVCNSDEIVETIEGYVCRNCGMVLAIIKLQYNIPYKEEAIQNSKGLGITQIGTNRERKTSPHSWLLYRLNKQNLIVESKRDAEIEAERVIPIILEKLRLTNSFAEGIYAKFKEIWPKLKAGSIYRNSEKLVAIIMYYYLKFQNIVIDKDELVDVSEISRDEFGKFQFQILQYFPEYKLRKRRELISKKLLRIKEKFNLDIEFYMVSKAILDELWKFINNTKDDVVAGLCASISVLVADDKQVKVHNVCKFLNIRMSTIQLQVKDKICKRFKISGFTTLVRSSGLLRVFLSKIGLLTSQEVNNMEIKQKKPQKVITPNLNNACRIFNPLNEHYLFELVNEDKNIILGYIKVEKFEGNGESFEKYGIMSRVKIHLILGNLFHSKDPPNRAIR